MFNRLILKRLLLALQDTPAILLVGTDEVQRVPELLLAIKRSIDESYRNDWFQSYSKSVLTRDLRDIGSQPGA